MPTPHLKHEMDRLSVDAQEVVPVLNTLETDSNFVCKYMKTIMLKTLRHINISPFAFKEENT